MTGTSAEPASIGPFVVLRRLGEGAMGVVYVGYDVVLDRRVAIKLVHPRHLGSAAVRGRMIREAQAMARLSSPYVVPVFQAGEHEDSLYLAMEYVEGQTLTAWLSAEPRPWQVVLRTVIEAGRGLAAAHAAGFIHRDFKPDNVLVDAEGHAHVLDFGLVRTGTDALQHGVENAAAVTEDNDAPPATTLPYAELELGRSSPGWTRLTQPNKAIGTPAYMSLEQHFGRPVGAATDQFSFAITLYEALYGARPFQGETWDQLRRVVQKGVVAPPPLHSRAPRRLFNVIQRGLAARPEDRWPSLDAMLAALERDPGRRRVQVAAVAGLLGLTAAAGYGLASVRSVEAPRCEASTRELAGVWDAEREAAVARAFTATRAPFAADTLTRVRSRLGEYADAWVGEHQAACEAHASGVQTGRMMDLRVTCLGRRKVHFAALVDQFGAADRAVVEHAVQAVAALPSLGDCSNVDALTGGPAPPNDPRTATRVESLRERLARAAVLEHTGQFGPGRVLASQVRGEAEVVGYAPLVAEAALVVGSLYMAEARWPEAEAALTEALQIGITDDLPAISAEATARRVFVVGEGLGRSVEALATETFAEALVQRARDDGRLAALLHNNLGAVYDSQGDIDAARAHYERTIARLQRRPGPADPLLAITHNNLGNMDLDRDEFAAARAHFRLARDLFAAILGEAHPFVAHAIAGLGEASAQGGADTEALGHHIDALARMEAAYGPEHLYLLQPLTGLGQAQARLGQPGPAALHFRRAVAIADARGEVHVMLARSLAGLAELAAAAGAREEALERYARAARVYGETIGADAPESARAATRAQALAAAPSRGPLRAVR
jgi:tRNA A-37 threonylcarbamoyl transferase component Bud32/tetratricopeptide (TPR) repeat protein